MKIKDIVTKNNLFLAPMAGYTDVAFRHLCKKYGAGLTTTEMISAKGLIYDSEKTKQLLITSPLEDIKAVQLFGHEPEVIAEAINHPVLNDFDIIDINMGCPAPKIIKNGEGSYLMTQIGLAKRIVETAVKSTNKPVTVKMRLGFDKNVAVEFAKEMENAGASAITVHGRLTSQGYSGKADYLAIAEVKRAVKIPVVANGDVCNRADYQKILDITKADAVMIGRGAVGNPKIFCELLGYNMEYDRLQTIKEQYQILMQHYDEHFVVTNMRKHLLQYFKGENIPNQLKLELMQCEKVEDVFKILDENFM
ncbi:MAG: tRNA dihydrouridine synthase DusB [Christensenellales bacterium]